MEDQKQLFYRVEQVAEALSCSRSKAYELVSTGELESVNFGKKMIRVPVASLEAWLEKQLKVVREPAEVNKGQNAKNCENTRK